MLSSTRETGDRLLNARKYACVGAQTHLGKLERAGNANWPRSRSLKPTTALPITTSDARRAKGFQLSAEPTETISSNGFLRNSLIP